MKAETRELFEIVFQEAHVVDFDFSQWDRRLRLVVSAGLVGENFEGRGALHNVDFVGVKAISWQANHLDVKLDSSEQHCQWVIMEFDIERSGEYEHIKLSGFGPTPSIGIVCKSIAISELDPRVIDQLNQNWNQPYRPLARPGFEELLAMRRSAR